MQYMVSRREKDNYYNNIQNDAINIFFYRLLMRAQKAIC